ncbi:MAG: 50S ribosomal protein L1 [Candidatus Heimdallarchaeota archaeon]|nr:50S ribosomal protein L1 [Candidatus Heimdallarchaeota archaeon]
MNVKELADSVTTAKKESKKRNFTESIDLAVNFRDLDLKSPSSRFNFQTILPHPIKKDLKVAIFASGELATKAKEAGINTILSRDDLEALGQSPKDIRKLAKEHDFFLAEPPFMPLIARYLGKYLAPRGKMPTPVAPTVDLKELIERLKRTVQLRVKSNPVVLTKVGDVRMASKDIAENIEAVIHALEGKLEHGIFNIRSAYIKTTMGESLKIEVH